MLQDLSTENPSTALLRRVPFEFARDHLVLPLELGTQADGTRVAKCLAASAELSPALDNLSLFLQAPLELQLAPETHLRRAISQAYQTQMAQSQALSQAQAMAAPGPAPDVEAELARLKDRDLLAAGGKEPVARLVDALLFDALHKSASDVHIHPYPDRLQVRYRVDGVLFDAYRPPAFLQDQIVGRVKVLAGMDVAEKRLPQDGRTSVTVGDRQLDLRVSTLPTTCGERVVIRLLEQTARLKALGELGMPPDVQQSFRKALERSTGLILVTGPTGSGKTTTLYSALAQLNAGTLNILTLEDPVEYRLEGISQTQVTSKKGLTFVDGLRTVLRQDPDVIFVGEIRDEPTARMVIQSSLTGHLVLSTLHTNSAAGAIARLVDFGIEPYLIASSLLGVLAQRLVRCNCPACPAAPQPACPTCRGSGYAGRTGVYEWLDATPAVKAQIQTNVETAALEQLAVSAGMRTLWQDGARLVAAGKTTDAEIARVIGAAESDG